ncbi:MAG: hypothetical protein DI543_01565 [Bradyrhizobium icense]|nr:MAG: hypothetical protein DI543_01565 [Bradyrhizobium icense]
MQHRPGPFAAIDERGAEPVPYPTYQDDPYGIDRNFQSNARGNPPAAVTSPERAAEQQRQSEIARIRNEIMDIAREVAELRRHEHDPAPAVKPNRGRPPRARNISEIEPPRIAAPISPQPDPRNRPQELRPSASGGRRPQLVERAHKHSRTGKAEPAIPSTSAPARAGRPPLSIRDEVLQFAPAQPKPPAKASKPAATKPLGMVARTALLTGMILVGTGVITAGLFGKLTMPQLEQLVSETTASIPPAKTAKQLPLQLASVADHAPLFEMPETYGVYAISDGHLTPLDPLPVRIPDARVSISSPVSKPAPAPLPHGNLQFAVYHRELATNVPESASVRIVAKVMQATTFVNGKPKAAAVEDIWAVRGGSIDFRIAPVAANKEMILIRPADPAFTLSPGRYVLVFRNQAYDFSVAGAITDTAQCLERSDLQDRSVYSECRELPDAARS